MTLIEMFFIRNRFLSVILIFCCESVFSQRTNDIDTCDVSQYLPYANKLSSVVHNASGTLEIYAQYTYGQSGQLTGA